MISKSAKQTSFLGEKLGRHLKTQKCPQVIALTGDLGSGKTTFTQGLARGLGVKSRLVSPTFILLRSYDLAGRRHLHHLDLYRLEKDTDTKDIGLADLLQDPQNILVIEWAEKIADILPPLTRWIKFSGLSPQERLIETESFEL